MGTLYEEIAGANWHKAPEAVRQAHCRHRGVLRASGRFFIRRGVSRMARCLSRWLDLPEAASAIPVNLCITPCAEGEQWVRTFGGKTIATFQRAVEGGLLGERVGPMEFCFQLKIDEIGVEYIQRNVSLNFGRLRLPLPHWAMPHVDAREVAVGNEHTHVHVAISFPVVGLLFEYVGELATVEAFA